MVSRSEIQWNKGEPYNTCRVHRETNVLRFIKRFRNLSCENRINGTNDYKNNGKEERNHVGRINVGVANEEIILSSWVMILGMRWSDDHPYDVDYNLLI